MEKENTLKLKRCNCGGTVELIESKPWNQDPCIYCSKCGGKMEIWNIFGSFDYQRME